MVFQISKISQNFDELASTQNHHLNFNSTHCGGIGLGATFLIISTFLSIFDQLHTFVSMFTK
jgi:hypothetical protein